MHQKTDFPFEALIHDDCSTDDSRKIIMEYHEKYPNIIRPVFADKNRFSRGISIVDQVLFPMARGTYIAMCEGDDYWCDEMKLQRQADYMDGHPECAMCLHNTRIHDLSGQREDRLFNDWKDVRTLTEDVVFFGWHVHTSSYMTRRAYVVVPPEINGYWFGDFVRLTYAYASGTVVCLPQVMSVYNAENPAGITWQISHYGLLKLAERESLRADYLEKFDAYTYGRFHASCQERIRRIRLDAERLKIQNGCSFEEFQQSAKRIHQLSTSNALGWKDSLKYHVVFGYPLWKLVLWPKHRKKK